MKKALAVVSALAVPFSVLTLAPAHASADGSGVVISEIYGAGGNSGATYDQDFVELYNPSGADVSLAGDSVQYRSATGTGDPSGVVDLTGTIPAHGHYLVGLAKGSTGAPLTAVPDQDAGVNISATKGTVFLSTQSAVLDSPPTGSLTGDPQILDLVGFGSTNTYETDAAPAPSTTESISRSSGADSDDNAADFTAGSPTAQASGQDQSPPPGGTHTIAQIQGSGDTSPYAGQVVSTDGVVTAAYPTGGFDGFYLQTGGTGGEVDLSSHHASDGIFVYGRDGADSVHLGDHVEVTGTAEEYHGLTEIDTATADGSVAPDPDPTPAVKPAQVPWPATDSARESLEGMLLAPQGDFTVADNYDLNQFGEIGLASGDQPLWQPTDVADPHDAAAIAAVERENAAKAVLLDDGSSWNYMRNDTAEHTPLPYLTQDHQIRVGEQVRFTQPVVLDYRYSAWGFQPTGQLTGAGDAPVTFSHTRTAAPAPTGGNLHLASFNVLNYFPTTGEDFVAAGGTCSWYDDIDGNHVTVDRCYGPNGEDGPRGAADEENLQRQQAKIVHAINALGADIVSLEEIENSAKFGHSRDWAVAKLVHALNAATGRQTWAYVPTPASAGDQSDEDVIRTAFIYRTASVRPVGASVIDDAPAFDIARDPLAQAWQPRRAGRPGRFLVIANHFKSKGSGPDDGTGQGNSNPQRIAQADELAGFAQRMEAHYGTRRVFLSGDFNSYTREDPMQHLYDAGYTDLGSTEHPDEATYLYGGLVGSLDHVLANRAALRMVTGAHVWNINSVEPVALEYSRHHYNVTDFYTTSPYRASDHDPLVVGIDDPSGSGHAHRPQY